MSQVIEVTDASFASVVLKADKPAMVDYWADWCAPCKKLAPVIEELAREYSDKVTFATIDTNTNPVTATQQGVMGLPTIQLFDHGQVVKQFTGAKTKSQLLKALADYL
jgi:thioredoxin 1